MWQMSATFSLTVSAGRSEVVRHTQTKKHGKARGGPANEGCSRRHQGKPVCAGRKPKRPAAFSAVLHHRCCVVSLTKNNKGSDFCFEPCFLPTWNLDRFRAPSVVATNPVGILFANKFIFSVLLFKGFLWKSNKNRRSL